MPCRLLLVALLLLVGLVSGAGARVEASPWLGPSVVSGPVQTMYGLQVAMAANGEAAAIWVEVGAHSRVVRAATRPADGPWQPPRNLSQVGQEAGFGFPDLAIDRKGNAVAVWEASKGSHDVVQAAVRRAGGRFRPPRTLARADQSVISGLGPPRVAIDVKGNAVAVWAGGTYPDPVVEFAAGTWRRGFGAPRDLAHGRLPDVAADARGKTTVVWESSRGVEAALRPARGRFGSPQALGTGAYVYPQVAVNGRGDALVAWTAGSYPLLTVQAAFRNGGERFGPAERVAPAGDRTLGLEAALDPRGNGILLWRSDRYETTPLQAAVRALGGRFGGVQVLAADAGGFALGIDGRGNATALWSRYAGDWVVQSATLARGSPRFGVSRDLSEHGYNALDPDIAVDAVGNSMAVWQRSQGRNFIVEAVTRSVRMASDDGG